VGCLLEQNVPDGMVGETARCIIADGFYRLRYADEFFVDIPNRRGSFTDGVSFKNAFIFFKNK